YGDTHPPANKLPDQAHPARLTSRPQIPNRWDDTSRLRQSPDGHVQTDGTPAGHEVRRGCRQAHASARLAPQSFFFAGRSGTVDGRLDAIRRGGADANLNLVGRVQAFALDQDR